MVFLLDRGNTSHSVLPRGQLPALCSLKQGRVATLRTISYTAIASVALLSLPLPFVWQTPSTLQQGLLLLGMATCAGLGELLVIKALEIALAVVVAPVHYSLILWSTFYGWVIFDQLPDQWTIVGSLIIVATGLYVLNRERLLMRAARRG